MLPLQQCFYHSCRRAQWCLPIWETLWIGVVCPDWLCSIITSSCSLCDPQLAVITVGTVARKESPHSQLISFALSDSIMEPNLMDYMAFAAIIFTLLFPSAWDCPYEYSQEDDDLVIIREKMVLKHQQISKTIAGDRRKKETEIQFRSFSGNIFPFFPPTLHTLKALFQTENPNQDNMGCSPSVLVVKMYCLLFLIVWWGIIYCVSLLSSSFAFFWNKVLQTRQRHLSSLRTRSWQVLKFEKILFLSYRSAEITLQEFSIRKEEKEKTESFTTFQLHGHTIIASKWRGET